MADKWLKDDDMNLTFREQYDNIYNDIADKLILKQKLKMIDPRSKEVQKQIQWKVIKTLFLLTLSSIQRYFIVIIMKYGTLPYFIQRMIFLSAESAGVGFTIYFLLSLYINSFGFFIAIISIFTLLLMDMRWKFLPRFFKPHRMILKKRKKFLTKDEKKKKKEEKDETETEVDDISSSSSSDNETESSEGYSDTDSSELSESETDDETLLAQLGTDSDSDSDSGTDSKIKHKHHHRHKGHSEGKDSSNSQEKEMTDEQILAEIEHRYINKTPIKAQITRQTELNASHNEQLATINNKILNEIDEELNRELADIPYEPTGKLSINNFIVNVNEEYKNFYNKPQDEQDLEQIYRDIKGRHIGQDIDFDSDLD